MAYGIVNVERKITLSALGGVPSSRKINGHALTEDVNLVKADIGLDKVDNTADSAKTVAAAGTADKLKTARTIAISGGATGTATSFDGSGNISIPVTALNPDNLSKVVPISKGGTNATTAAAARKALGVDYGTAAGTVCQGNDSRLSNARTPTSHTHPASQVTAGTLPAGVLATNGTDYGTSRLRNVRASTSDLTAGSSALSNGEIYLVYE